MLDRLRRNPNAILAALAVGGLSYAVSQTMLIPSLPDIEASFGASPSETVTNILENQPTPLTKLSPERPTQLEHIVGRLTAKRADERYETARALLDDLAMVTVKLRDGRRSLFGRLFREK